MVKSPQPLYRVYRAGMDTTATDANTNFYLVLALALIGIS
jgi:hypothetical protein